MKRLALWIIVGTICLGMASIGQAQQSGEKAKASSRLPDEVCKAVEQYVARIDSARSIKEKAKREEKYAEARDSLAAVLKTFDKASLLSQASEYAQYTESVASADPRDPKFDELLGKRLKLRSALLDPCDDYTSRR